MTEITETQWLEWEKMEHPTWAFHDRAVVEKLEAMGVKVRYYTFDDGTDGGFALDHLTVEQLEAAGVPLWKADWKPL